MVVVLMFSKALENHEPAFTRKWLKERILTALPHLKYVLQKDRRESAVLYSPEACEEEMVHAAMATDEDDESIMKAIYKEAHVIRKSIATFTKTGQGTDKDPLDNGGAC